MRTRINDDTQDGFSSGERRRKRFWPLWMMLLAILIIIATGCSASLGLRPTVAGYAVAPAATMPGVIDNYPRMFYQDRYAYLIDGQWYYPTSDGWVVFLEEPRPLVQYRARLQTAPPARRQPDVYYGHPSEQPQPRRLPPRQPTPPQELRREYRPE